MPKAYTLTPRPKNLSTVATFIHRLRHPLRIQRVRHSPLLPANSGSVRTESDKRRPRVEGEWLEAPTSHGSPYELVEIGDKGEYTEQRYGNVNVYWNSVMVEASEEEKWRRREAGEKCRKQKRKGMVFGDSEPLYKAHDSRQRTWDRVRSSTAAPQRTRSLPKSPSTNPTLSDHGDGSYLPTPLDRDDNGDRYTTLTENISVANLNMHPFTDTGLTWNSALTRILASPCVDLSVSSTIRARARGRRPSRDPEEVDMRGVSMVPNFSYPIASARWCDACAASDWPFLEGDGCGNRIGGVESGEPRPIACNALVNADDDVSFPDLEDSDGGDDDSLYRAPTPASPKRRTSDPGSVLRDILDPEELDMYQEIMRHNPRFTVLLDRADRQVPLVAKSSAAVEVLMERRADFEGCKTCHDPNKRMGVYDHLRLALTRRERCCEFEKSRQLY